MRRSRLRVYCLLSLLLHALCLWLFRFVPVSAPVVRPPVAIRLLDPPPSLRPKATPAPERQRPVPPPRAQVPPPSPPSPPSPPPPLAKPEPPPPPKQGGIVTEIPKPQRQERPDKARILSEYDSKAQDGTGGEPGARKPSGERPPEMPPQLPLPERYSRKGPQQARPESPPPPAAAPRKVPPAAASPEPKVQAKTPPPAPPVQASKPAPPKPAPQERGSSKEQRLTEAKEGPIPVPERAADRDKRSASRPTTPAQTPPARAPQEHPPTVAPSEERRFSLTAQQELAMLQRQQPSTSDKSKNTLEEHFARLEQRLPLFSFDAPGTYAKGQERPGEGQAQSGGGKYRSIDAYGIKHFSYLMQLKRKIEMVFSVPPFATNRGKVGIPIIGFTIRRNGELAEAVVLHSSGYPEFDQAVVRAIRRAAPYYPFPEHLPEQEISIQVFVTLS